MKCKQTADVYNLKCKQIAGIAKNISKQLIHIHNWICKQTAKIFNLKCKQSAGKQDVNKELTLLKCKQIAVIAKM